MVNKNYGSIMANFKVLAGIFLERMKDSMKSLYQDSLYPNSNSKQISLKYKYSIIATPTCSLEGNGK
jgi:hypothetical protein